MLTGIPRRLNVSFLVAIAVFVLACGVYAAEGASSYGATVSGGSADPLSGFPAAGHSAIPFAVSGSAVLSRNSEGTFGSFSGESPQALAVDGANGDVYALDTNSGKLLRFTAGGAPADFSAGSGAGTNEIPGLSLQHFPSFDQVGVDNSGGPSAGNVYVTESGSSDVRVFASSGEELATLKGEKTPGGFGEDCGVAVDPANGNVFVASWSNRIWRYSPTGSSITEASYSGGISTSINPCELAVASGRVYVKEWKENPLGGGGVDEFETKAFSEAVPSVAGTQVAGSATAVAADSASGDVYVDEGNRVSVLDGEGEPLYTFAGGEVGSKSTGVAVRAGGDAYVSDSSSNVVHRYGATLQAGTRANLGSFADEFVAESPQSLAVDDASGDVYTIDSASGRVSRFTGSGARADFSAGPGKGTNRIPGLNLQHFPSFDQVAVDNSGGPSAGNVYVTESGSSDVRVFASTGEELATLKGEKTPGGFGEDCGVAVDPSDGDVYIANWNNRIWRYTPTGSTITEADYTGGIQTTGVNPCELAITNGHLYAKEWKESPLGGGGVVEYETSVFSEAVPSLAGTQVAGGATALAVDQNSGQVLVDGGNQVSVLNAGGETLYSFGAGEIGTTSTGVAVGSSGDVYVSDSSNTHAIHIFGPFSSPPPIVETDPATGVTHVKATLKGHLDPNNGLPITSCSFEIGTDTSYSEPAVPCAQGNTFTAPADVTAQLSGLTPGTTRHYRLHITTATGPFDGQDQSFETIPASTTPEVSTGKGSTLSTTSTEMQGAIDPNGNALSGCHFEYVTDAAYQLTGFNDLSSGGDVPCDQAPGSIPADFEDHQVTATATGLVPSQIYRYRLLAENNNGTGQGETTLLPGPPIPETTGSPTRTTTTARLDSRVIPHGASTSYWFEYVTDAQYKTSGFSEAISTPHQPLTTNEIQRVVVQNVALTTAGNFKLSFGGYTTPDLRFNASAAEVQTALSALPSIGQGNIHVESTPEYPSITEYAVTFKGALGNINVEPLVGSVGTPPSADYANIFTFVDGGPSDRSSLVSMPVNGLQASTTYHYRVAADNGTPGGPAYGDGQTLTTRVSDAPLTHGSVAGPPGSDRAWEEVNVPDTNDNPVVGALTIADSGERVIYAINGGTPGSTYGGETLGTSNEQFAERTPGGWQRRDLFPTRAQAPGNVWLGPWGSTELTELYAVNYDETHTGLGGLFRLTPGAPAQTLLQEPFEHFSGLDLTGMASDDGSRVIVNLPGTRDPAYPVEQGREELYDLSSGSPKVVDLLPGNTLPPCGAKPSEGDPEQDWITPDGSHAFFEVPLSAQDCGTTNNSSLFDRDLVKSTTTLISPNARFIRYAAGSVFFTTTESLVSGDHGGNDIYRYQVDNGSVTCVTCSTAVPAEVRQEHGNIPFESIAVSADGSRVYFVSRRRLVPGAASTGIYRVDVASGSVAYVAPDTFGVSLVTADPKQGGSLSPDGSIFAFWSYDPGLNAVNGQQSGGTAQYYLYDDRDRSLVCVSCSPDGTTPRGGVSSVMESRIHGVGANQSLVTNSGDFFFTTPTPLVAADQNTAAPGQEPGVGDDIYEWRDGRLLLVTDGKTETEKGVSAPQLDGVAGGGRDVFFSQSVALTPDAIDSSHRLYDARIGGGFEFAHPAAPCSLEACQGTPLPPPSDGTPASLSFSGPGNQTSGTTTSKCVVASGGCAKSSRQKRCAKGTVRKHGKCVKKHKRKSKGKRAKRANHNKGGAK